MVIIIFGLPFALYYPISRLPISVRDKPPAELVQTLWYEFFAVLVLTFIFSAFEGGGWGWIFGIIFTCGWVFSYHFYFGNPIWLIVLEIIGGGLLFGFICAIFGGIGEELKCWVIERKIKELEEVIKRNESILESKDQIEKQIDEIIALDPSNLSVKAGIFRQRAIQLATDEIQSKINEIEVELQKVIQLKMSIAKELDRLECEKEVVESKLEAVIERLRKLELADPANVGIRLQKLRSVWNSLNESELEKVKATGEVEFLLREQLLLEFQKERKSKEIANIKKELADLKFQEHILTLEKLVLELETTDRRIKLEKPQLLKTHDELKKLKLEYDKMKAT